MSRVQFMLAHAIILLALLSQETLASSKRQATFSCEKACSLEQCRLPTRCPFDGPYMCTSGDIAGGCSTEIGLWPQTVGCDDCCDVSFCFVPCGRCNVTVCDGYTIDASGRRRQGGGGGGGSSTSSAAESAGTTGGGGGGDAGGGDGGGGDGVTVVPPLCPAGIAPFACIEGPSQRGCSADRNLWPGVANCWKCCDMQQCESFTPAPPTPPPPTPQPNCSDPDVSCNSEQEAAAIPPTPAPLPIKPTAADYSGNVWSDPDDIMLLCGKCQTDGGFTGSDSLLSTPTYFILECDADLTGREQNDPTGTRIGTMRHRCEPGCQVCDSETQIVLGERVRYFSNQFSASFSVPDTDRRAGIAASLHCCSNMVRVRSHRDSRCNSDDLSSSDYYYPVGCQLGGERGIGEFQHFECPGHLAPPIVSPCSTRLGSWFEEQLGTFVSTPCPLISNEGYCPKGQYQVENSPCATVGSSSITGAGAANISNFLGPEYYPESYYTLECWVDQSQRCLRIVRGDRYNETISNTSRPLGRIVEECVGGFVEAPATPSPNSPGGGEGDGDDIFVEGSGAARPFNLGGSLVLEMAVVLIVALGAFLF